MCILESQLFIQVLLVVFLSVVVPLVLDLFKVILAVLVVRA